MESGNSRTEKSEKKVGEERESRRHRHTRAGERARVFTSEASERVRGESRGRVLMCLSAATVAAAAAD